MATWAVNPAIRLAWEQRGSNSEDLYGCLGVDTGVSPDDLKTSYRNGLRAHHPDKGGDARDGSMLTVAYRILSDPDKRAVYDQCLRVAYKPYGEMPIPPGFSAAFKAVQHYEEDLQQQRHNADVEEQRRSEAKHLRIVQEAANARRRAERQDQRAFERQARLMEDTEACRKRMRELLQFQKENAQRRTDDAEQAALLKARDLEDKRRKQEQRKRLAEAKEERLRKQREEAQQQDEEERMRKLRADAEAGRQEAMQFIQEENAKLHAAEMERCERIRQLREAKAQSAMPSSGDDVDENADMPGLVDYNVYDTITSLWPTSWQHMFELFHNPHVYELDPRPQEVSPGTPMKRVSPLRRSMRSLPQFRR